jgi:hypothetical protein
VDFPAFKIEDKELPIMLCGSSPFIGLGQFGFKAFEYRVRFYNHPDNMADLFVHFVRQGCKGAHIHCYDNIVKAVEMAYDVETFPVAASLTTKDVTSQLKKLSALKTVLVFVHPSQTDSLNKEVLQNITKKIRDAGMIPGLTTNVPGVSIPQIDAMGLDVSAYRTPLNIQGKYMTPGKEQVLKAIENTDKKILATNPLVEKVSPEVGLPFVMEHCNGFCVGFTEKDHIDAVYNALATILKK